MNFVKMSTLKNKSMFNIITNISKSNKNHLNKNFSSTIQKSNILYKFDKTMCKQMLIVGYSIPVIVGTVCGALYGISNTLLDNYDVDVKDSKTMEKYILDGILCVYFGVIGGLFGFVGGVAWPFAAASFTIDKINQANRTNKINK